MKRILLSVGLLMGGYIASAQTIVTSYAQYKTTVLEEFTGIHCQFCPDGHKLAKEMKNAYPGRVLLVNIHEGGYAIPSGNEPDFRTPYGTAISNRTGLTGYPSGTINRRVFPSLNAGAMALSRSLWRTAGEMVIEERSPMNIGATTAYNSATRTITINVEAFYTKAGVGSENLLNIAILEDSVVGPQTGGSTYNPADVLPGGMYNHDHVLRDFITGQWGDTISNTALGALYAKTFTYVIPDSVNNRPVDPDHCHLAIYATENKGNILQGISLGIDGAANNGNNAPFYGEFVNSNTSVKSGATGSSTSFSFDFTSAIQAAQDFKFELTSNAPSSWSGSYTLGGNTYTGTATVNMASLANSQISIDVTPGTDAAVATYTLTAYPSFDPNTKVEMQVNVISGITELIVNGTGGWGDGNTYNWDQEYEDGLISANSTTYATVDADLMEEAITSQAMQGVEDIYMNIGWRFPSFSDDQATALKSFMDNGGNVFVAGQDIGWDINETNGYGTPITKDLYTSYFNASYVADGSAANNSLMANSSDFIFGNVATSAIVDKYAGNMYPDQMNPINGASAIFHYDAAKTKVGGIRHQTSNYKMVFLGIGVEMIQDATVRDEVLRLSYDWFKGNISTEEFDLLTKGFEVYPNPTAGDVTIEVPVAGLYGVSILNAAGTEVRSLEENTNSGKIEIPGADLSSGIYLIKLTYADQTITKKLMVK